MELGCWVGVIDYFCFFKDGFVFDVWVFIDKNEIEIFVFVYIMVKYDDEYIFGGWFWFYGDLDIFICFVLNKCMIDVDVVVGFVVFEWVYNKLFVVIDVNFWKC